MSADANLTGDGPRYIDINPRLVEPGNARRAGVDLVTPMLELAAEGAPPVQRPGRAGVATHQLLIAVLGAAQRTGRRGAVLAELLAAGVAGVLGIVYALLALAIVIAVSGIVNTLSLSVYERTREIGLLRAVGQTRPQLRSMVRLESARVSGFGTAGGLLLGGFAGWALAEAGARSSGLTMVSFPAAQLLLIAILGGAAGVIAVIRPARLPVLRAIAAE